MIDKTQKLKNIILNRYGSIREFSKFVEIPSTTLTSALDKGIGGMAIDRVIKICELLNIDVKTFEPLNVELKENNLTNLETRLLKGFNQLNDLGKEEAIKRVKELTEISKYTQEEKEYLKPLAAHDRDGVFSEEDKQHDLDMMSDNKLWD